MNGSGSPQNRSYGTSSWCSLVLAVVGLFLDWGAGSVRAEEPPRPLKALLVTGGCCHDYSTQKQLIKNGLEERARIVVDVVQQGGQTTDARIPLYENPNWADGYDVVIHDECFSNVPDPAWTRRILKPHQEGVPAVVVHCAMHCYRDGTDQWFEFCGVTSRRHGAHYAHEVLNRAADHPIMQGFGAGWANPAGELYWIEKVWPTATPLAAAKNREKGNEEVCVWTNQYGDTRVFGTTLGHHNETVSAPQFLDLLTRGTLWACNQLNDQYLKPRQPRQVPENLSPQGKATASSEETSRNNFAPLANDGNRGTRWCAVDGSAPQWWQVDLGAVQKVTGCELHWENPTAVYRYKVETSLDGSVWQSLVDRSTAADLQPHRHLVPALDAKFVRVTFLGCNTGGWGSLWEVEVFGEKLVTLSQTNPQQEAELARLNEVRLPDGFEATVFAVPPAVHYPVFVAAAPDGTLYVSCDKNGSLDREARRGSVVRLRDRDGDGRADESKLFVPDVDSPRGLVWDQDRLYLLHPPHLSAFIDHDGDGISDEQKVLVKNIAFTFKDRPADHTSNGVTLGADGWLYLAIGDFGFMEAEGTDGRKLQLRAGGVVRVRTDGTGMELYSRGTRNILEVGLDPLLNGFARDNTNDGGGWDIRLHHFSGLDEHGYPSLYRHFPGEFIQPLADYGGGSGCGALYLDEPYFPSGFDNALYTADWGRQQIFRHRLQPQGASFQVDQQEFLGLPRVTDLDVDAQGQIFAASWKGATFRYEGDEVGYVVRVVPRDRGPVEPLPDFARASDTELVALHASRSHRRRLAAQRALLRRELKEPAIAGLQAIAADSQQPLAGRVAALFTLKQALGVAAHPLLVPYYADELLREYVIRALTDREDQLDGVPLEIIMGGLFDSNPRVRLAALVGMARLKLIDLAGEMTPLLADPDPRVALTAVHAMRAIRASEACFVVLDQTAAGVKQRQAAAQVLQGLHESSVVDGLVLRLEREPEAAKRQDLLQALCRLYFIEGTWQGDSWGTRPDTRGPYYQPEPWSQTDRLQRALQAALVKADAEETHFLVNTLIRHRIPLAGALDRLVDLAERDERMVAAAVRTLILAQQRLGEPLTPRSQALLISAVNQVQAAPAMRSQAIIALLSNPDETAFRTILNGLARLDQQRRHAAIQDGTTADRKTAGQVELVKDAPTSSTPKSNSGTPTTTTATAAADSATDAAATGIGATMSALAAEAAPAWIAAWDAFRNSTEWDRHIPLLVRLADEQTQAVIPKQTDSQKQTEPKKQNSSSIPQDAAQTPAADKSTLAHSITIDPLVDAALIVASTRQATGAELRKQATDAIERAWQQSARRRQLLEAAQVTEQRAFEPRIRQALTDSDRNVVQMASLIASQWGLKNVPSNASPLVKSLTPELVLADSLKRKGDLQRGAQVFARLNCGKCHTIQAGEMPRGPHLPNVAKTYQRAQLAESVLLPNKSLAQGFVTNAFILDNGRTIVGFVTNEAADQLTVRDNEGKEIKIPVASIDERSKLNTSVMPTGQVDELTLDEFASLIDYLQSLAP